jgi:hypothetical protein
MATSSGSSQPEWTINILSLITPSDSKRSISAILVRATLESCVE